MKICFYCHIKNPKFLELIDFYNQDIKILKEIDPELKISTKFQDIDWNADVIFIWWWTYAFFPTVMARIKKRKTVITGTFNYRCPEVQRDYFKRPFWQRILIRFATKLANTNIMVSKNELLEISEDWKFDNYVYSPHCVDTEKYIPIKDNKRSNYLFTICGLDRQSVIRKCLYELIDSLYILKKEGIREKLIIAGRRSDAYDDIRNYIYQIHLEEQIDLVGEISEDEKIEYLQKCKCYMQPSRYEGFGLAIAEAMSCGCNIITSNVGEIPNVVGETGIIINSTNSRSIAEAIRNIIHLKENNEATRNRIVKYFPIERRRKDINDILNNL